MPVQDRQNLAPLAEGDSAMQKLANDPSSRSRFLKQVGGAGAAGAFAIFLSACGDDNTKTTAAASSAAAMKDTDNAGDLAIVNYALTLEYLEAQFYKDVVKSGILKGAEQDIAKMFGEQEAQHVAALKGTADKLGGAVAAPEAKFPIENRMQVLKLADVVENLGAAAYLGQAGNIKSPEVLAAALSIHSVEARHASALNVLLGRKPSPDGAFAVPADMATVLKAVKPFIVSTADSSSDSMGGSN